MLAHIGHHLLGAMMIPLLPFIRDNLTLDYTQAGWLVSAYLVSYGVGQLPGGWLADRIGPRTVLTIGISGVALSGLLAGLSPTYIMLVVFFVLLGITGGGYHPAAVSVLSASVDPEKRGRALGLHQIGGAASHFLSPLIAIALVGTLGWRGSFIGTAIPIIVFGIVFYVLLGRWGYTGETRQEISESSAETPPAPGRLGNLVTFIILTIVGQTVIVAVINFIPLFLVDEFGVSGEVAAALLALTYSAGFWAAPLGGYLSDRVGTVPVLVVVSFITGLIIYLLDHASYGLGIGALLVLFGMSLDSRMPVSESYITSHTSERNRSTVLGIYYFGSRGGPGVIAPVLGYLIDQVGFRVTFTIVGAAMTVVTLVCSAFLWGSQD